MSFNINSKKLKQYFEILHMYACFGHIPIASMIIFNDFHYAISCNSINEHAEYILLHYYKYTTIQAILITLEPCISCAFHIINLNIPYVFFSNYNDIYGGFKYINYKHKCKIFGGLYITPQLQNFFILKRDS